MKKTLLIRLMCLALALVFILPLVVACGEETPETPSGDETEEMVLITFNARGGDIIDGKDEIEIVKGSKLKESKLPEVEKNGYTFKCWAYDKAGKEEWDPADKFREDTDLYAIWEEKSSGNNGGNENDDEQGGNTPGGNTPGGDDIVGETITIEYNTGSGKLEDINAYEKVIKKGTRYDSHPTPINDNPAMVFRGWFLDATCEDLASSSYKYENDTMLYAKWVEVPQCTDLTYNHVFTGGWTDGKPATCTTPPVIERYCDSCSYKEEQYSGNKLGHQWGQWQEAFMRKERTCGRGSCGEKEIFDYENVTNAVLGDDKSAQIESTGKGTFYTVNPFTLLFNNNWDEEWTASMIPHGNGDAELTVTLANPDTLDRIYVKGVNGGTVDVSVLYEGDTKYTSLGSCSFLSAAEDEKPKNERLVPYVETDATRVILSVKFTQKSPSQGTNRWQEIAFVKVVTEAE